MKIEKKYMKAFILLFIGIVIYLLINKPELLFFPSKEVADNVKNNYSDLVKQSLYDIGLDSLNYKIPLAIICVESKGKLDAVGNDGELGLMQPLYSTAYDFYKWNSQTDILDILGITETTEENFQNNYWLKMYDAKTNIRMGCNILRMLKERYNVTNDYDLIRCYNAGQSAKNNSLLGQIYLARVKAYLDLL